MRLKNDFNMSLSATWNDCDLVTIIVIDNYVDFLQTTILVLSLFRFSRFWMFQEYLVPAGTCSQTKREIVEVFDLKNISGKPKHPSFLMDMTPLASDFLYQKILYRNV